MILVDTSVWIDHLRAGDAALASLLAQARVLTHPFIIGELALGNIKQRAVVLESLQNLPKAAVAGDDEVLHFVTENALFGLGIGYVDVHLLASARLTAGSRLFTRDKRLLGASQRLDLAAELLH